MDAHIHITGLLTAPVLQAHSAELEALLQKEDEPVIAINSGGGSSDAAREFYEKFLPFQPRITTVIREAGSAAALIALLGSRRKMSPMGIVELHPGAIVIESNSIPENGILPADQVSRMIAYRDFYLGVMRSALKIPSDKWSRLSARNRLAMNMHDCMQCGFAHEIAR